MSPTSLVVDEQLFLPISKTPGDPSIVILHIRASCDSGDEEQRLAGCNKFDKVTNK